MHEGLTASQFDAIARVAREHWGLHLTEQKRTLVSGRLGKHLARSPHGSAEEFCRAISDQPSAELLQELFELLSTNTTSFFREDHHFDFLADQVYPALCRSGSKRLRIWSAACSNGSEAYTAVMHAMEHIPGISTWDFRVLATDLSPNALAQARAGTYPAEAMESVPPRYSKYFEAGADGQQRIAQPVRDRVAVHELNLMGRWPMRGPFDVILLRNVMIYFDSETRAELVTRAGRLLSPTGVLIVGSSETLTGSAAGMRSLAPAIYSPQTRRAAA